MCVFVFFCMCFFLNFRLVTYNSTNLQLFFFYFPGDVVTQKKKMLGPRFCFVLFLFHSLSQRFRNHCLSPREALMLNYKISLCLFVFLETDWVYRLLRFVFFFLLLGYVNSLGKEPKEKLKNGSEN